MTGFGLIGGRERDSMGFGAGLSRLNPHLFARSSELMFQAYYQAHLFATTFLPTHRELHSHPGRIAHSARRRDHNLATHRAVLALGHDQVGASVELECPQDALEARVVVEGTEVRILRHKAQVGDARLHAVLQGIERP